MTTIRFLSANQHKIKEVQKILSIANVNVVPLEKKIEELQTSDEERLVKDKALKAFRDIGRPLFVEHTGLHLAHLKGLPGGLTQIFWDSLEADRFAELFGKTSDTSAIARTTIGYIDGRRLHFFRGEVHGSIASEPKGDRAFQWDCVFIPNGYSQTFSELGEKKHDISMRKLALDSFVASLLKA